MKTLLLLTTLFCTNIFAANLSIKITNLQKKGGTMNIAIWDGPQGFPKDYNYAIQVDIFEAKEGMIATFNNLPAGNYALAIFHDENSNGDLDTNAVGIPSEGFGFSNNPRILFGPPSFNKAKIKLGSSNKTISVKLKHF